MDSNFEQEFQEVSSEINNKLQQILPEIEPGKDGILAEAMRYSVLAPSAKRIRPFLTLATANIFGVSVDCSLNAAAAIELIHTYSLIHDDLPSMDNDDIRRGQPSCHIKFGEATAILAGDALLTLAFEIMSTNITHPDSTIRCELIKAVANASGIRGMVGGQSLDIISGDNQMNINEIIRMQSMKTGKLFVVACEMGAILGKASKAVRTALRGYAQTIGLAFQITDDLIDYESYLNQGNKKNEKEIKCNYAYVTGIEKSQDQARILIEQAVEHLDIFDHRADLLRDLAQFILFRKK